MGFCQWFKHFRDKINVLKLLKLELIVLVFKQHSSQSQKWCLYIRLLTIKDTSSMNEDSPSFWTKLVNIEGKTSKIRSHTKESRLQVKKIRIIEVLFMKENN